jgi:hypothetical protein
MYLRLNKIIISIFSQAEIKIIQIKISLLSVFNVYCRKIVGYGLLLVECTFLQGLCYTVTVPVCFERVYDGADFALSHHQPVGARRGGVAYLLVSRECTMERTPPSPTTSQS